MKFKEKSSKDSDSKESASNASNASKQLSILPPKFRLKVNFDANFNLISAANGLPSPAATASYSSSSSTLKRPPSSPSPSQSPSQSIPFSKRLRLTYALPVFQAGASSTLSPSLDLLPSSPYISTRINRPAFSNSAPHHCPSPSRSSDTKLRALRMVRWAVACNAVLKNEYVPIAILGWGGCGAVFEAKRKSDSALVAIKIMYKSNKRTGIPAEIEILSSLSHSSIVRYHTHFEDREAWYLVMERFGKIWKSSQDTTLSLANPLLIDQHISSSSTNLTGTSSSLFEFIDHSKGGKVPVRSMRPLFKQICQALVFLHDQNIIHGDLKEENILIGTVKGRLVAKLCDFGHSCRVDIHNPKMRLYGTRVLTPPEMLNHLRCEERGDKCFDAMQIGFKQDIWALGIVFWTMLHGALPSENERYINGEFDLSKYNYYPTSFLAITDHDCLDLLQRMLCIDPKRRLSAQQVLAHVYFK